MEPPRTSEWRDVVADLESDGLLPELTKVHSLVIRDIPTGEFISCSDNWKGPSIETGLRYLEKAERIYGHNVVKFDAPALRKVYGFDIPLSKLRDTLIIAGMRWTDLKARDSTLVEKGQLPGNLLGSHKLEAWGHRLGCHKGDFKGPWDTWTPEMQTYCEQDTEVTRQLVLHIRKAGATPTAAIETEQILARYLHQQETNGCPFDMEKAAALYAKLSARRQELTETLKGIFGWWWAPNGETNPKRGNKKQGVEPGCPYSKVKRVDFSPSSRHHIANRLKKLYGWQPVAFTPSGEPQVDEDVLKRLPKEWRGVAELTEYFLIEKRIGQLAEGKQAWLRLAKLNPQTGLQHIHGRVKQDGTITHRGAHINPNLGQVPKVSSPFGAECRELFYVPPGWTLVGADASSLEARVAAHYLHRYDGGSYGKLLLEGDVHTANRDALGLPATKKGRDDSKTFYYAFLYGAGDELLGGIVAPTLSADEKRKLGSKLRKRFLKNTPALARLVATVQQKAKQEGRLTLPDGRMVPCRSQHAALNFLFQGAGAVICKTWIARFAPRLEAELGPPGWDGNWAPLLWVHDEIQAACRPQYAERMKTILVEEMRALTAHFKWRVQLDGESKSGPNWAATH